ncbi:riboflavin synthase [Sphingomonas gilva]|uniref:Riboflavin synthase n=1 Tax=Sphingomonas gilva TaxID=2305907 RepID=A0A396S311_9SPHN|nr:riboflavin synthase [Sphingomonas gilva]RHW17765.1 riboflavin synthase [Sphingomonas gilva]
MFTGIITDIGTIEALEQRGDLRVRIATAYDTATIALGASIACSGVCLTVVDLGPGWFAVDVSAETVSRTAQGQWNEGRRLNLERALKVGDELGGHIVTGHVDGVGEVVSVTPEGDSHRVTVAAPRDIAPHLAAKGSIAVDGVSLTVNAVEDTPEGTRFGLNIIPHTAAMTTLAGLGPGMAVNLEIDVLSRYLARMRDFAAA